MARQETANTIINRVALEVGLLPSNDPFADTDESFLQLRGLLDAAGQELVEYFPWQVLNQVFEFTTVAATDTGTYTLPTDFSYMIDQTGWDQTNNVAIGGPLSPQDWSYLAGRDLVSQSIYASFRLNDNELDIYPQPPPDGLLIRFEYISRNWAEEQGTGTRQDTTIQGSDLVLYEPILIVKFLKAKFLEAKGFDPSTARLEFENMFNSRTGKDTGAPILNAGRGGGGFPYLDPYRNTRDTGFGS
jgi:hypothetical protein